jgi:hypothetical protein
MESMLMRKTIILSTCFGFALLDHAGVTSAAEETSPISLTASQMDKVTAGTASSTPIAGIASSHFCNQHPRNCRLIEIGGTQMPPNIHIGPELILVPIVSLLEHR